MPETTQYQNFVNPIQEVAAFASENLQHMPVWRQHVNDVGMPTTSQTKEIKKKGTLARSVLPENQCYTYGAYSEYIETSTLLNAIKSVVISKVTVEAETFGTQDANQVIGEEQGKALSVGFEEDVSTLVASASSSLVAGGAVATQLDLLACGLDIQVSTNGHAQMSSNLVCVTHPKVAFEAGVVDVLQSGVTIHGNSQTSFNGIAENFAARRGQAGYVNTIGGLDIYTTNIIDDDGTNYRTAVFDPTRAFVGFWDKAVRPLEQLEIECFRNRLANFWFTDVELHWDEAICRYESPIL